MFNSIKKFQFIFALLVIILIAFVSICFASQTNDGKESNGVVVYSISRTVYNQFLECPSKEILDQKESDTMISIYKKSDTSEGNIRREIISKNPVQVDESKGGTMRIGSMPVYVSLVDFIGDKENIKKFLSQNDVVGEIKNVAMLEDQNIPVTIWLQVNQENFFITIDEKFEDYSNNPNTNEYVYRLYTYLEYRNKFGIKDGKLKVNDKDITEGNYVKFQYYGVYIPFRAIMENLGAKVDWDADRNVVLLTCNDKEYILETNNVFSLVEVGESWNILTPPPGGSYCFEMIDDRINMDDFTMQAVVGLMGAKINIDYENLTVEVIK